MSYLYIIAGPDKKPVKLGLSKHPDKRVKQLQTGSSVKYQIYYIEEIEDKSVLKAEQFLHSMLGYKRLEGEWFNMTVDEAIADIKFARMTNEFSSLF